MKEEAHPPGTYLIRQGEVGDKFYLIKKGNVEVYVDDGTASHLTATLWAGEVFGEVALLEDKPRNATVVTKDEVEVYTLSKEGFHQALAASEPMREELIKVFCQRDGHGPDSAPPADFDIWDPGAPHPGSRIRTVCQPLPDTLSPRIGILV